MRLNVSAAAVAQVAAVAEVQARRIGDLGESFGRASRDTAEIAVVMAEQDARGARSPRGLRAHPAR